MTETAQQAARQATQITGLRERYLKELHAKPKAVASIDPLFKNPFLILARAGELLKVSLPTGNQVVKLLEEAGVLQEVTDREWGKIYIAGEISKVIEIPD
jgi:Fic family protein